MEIGSSVNLSWRFLNHDCDYLHLRLTNKVIAMNLQIIQPYVDHSYSLFLQIITSVSKYWTDLEIVHSQT